MTSEEEAIFQRALKDWGVDAQLGQLQEECGELIAAINQLRRGRPNSQQHLVEEIADVSIVLDQLKLCFPEHLAHRSKKIERLRKRLDKRKAG